MKLTVLLRKDETLKAVFKRIAKKHDGFGAMIFDPLRGCLYDNVIVFVNNRSTPKNLKIKIKPGDIVAVSPYYLGG